MSVTDFSEQTLRLCGACLSGTALFVLSVYSIVLPFDLAYCAFVQDAKTQIARF